MKYVRRRRFNGKLECFGEIKFSIGEDREVNSSAKVFATAIEYDCSYRAFPGKPVSGGAKLFKHRHVDGVEFLRPIQHHVGDVRLNRYLNSTIHQSARRLGRQRTFAIPQDNGVPVFDSTTE